MKILIAPGAFKHSLTAFEAAEAMARGLKKSGLQAELQLMPAADGGNGTLEAFLVAGGERVTIPVADPLMRPIQADYGLLDAGKTAVIEMALASGLELLKPHELNPFLATTYGTGQLMQHALERGATRFIIGMGGSATVDGGAGALQALGVYFADEHGKPIAPGNAGLASIISLHANQLDPRWQQVDIIIASDVDNPAVGADGAAAVFGAQKGATFNDIPILESHLIHYFKQIQHWHGIDVSHTEGGGAAGALAAGLLAFLGGRIQSGVELLLEQSGFRAQLADTDLVITGEGQLDSQTIHGKTPHGIARVAREYNVPTIAFAGSLNADDFMLHDAGFQAVLPIMDKPMSLEEALARAKQLVERAALRLGYILKMSC